MNELKTLRSANRVFASLDRLYRVGGLSRIGMARLFESLELTIVGGPEGPQPHHLERYLHGTLMGKNFRSINHGVCILPATDPAAAVVRSWTLASS